MAGLLSHLSKIGFDYRVRADSQLVQMIGFDCRMAREGRESSGDQSAFRKTRKLYFGKHELACYKLLRETDEAIFNAREVLVKSGFRAAWKQILRALRLSRSPRVLWKICSFFVLWFRIIASRFKRRIKSKFNASGQADSSA